MIRSDPPSWHDELDTLVAARRDRLAELGADEGSLVERAVRIADRLPTGAPAPVLALVVFAAAVHDHLLRRGKSPEAATDDVGDVIRGPWIDDPDLLRRFLRARYGVDPRRPSSAWHEAAVRFKPRGEAVFGPSFEYVQERLDDDHSWVNVTRCFMHDALGSLGKPELVRVFCALDAVIADVFEREGAYEVTLEQVSAMGRGDEVCRFRFSRREGR